MTGSAASSLQVVLHIVGLHIESDESVLHQVLNGVKRFLSCRGTASVIGAPVAFQPSLHMQAEPLPTYKVTPLLCVIIETIVPDLATKPGGRGRERERAMRYGPDNTNTAGLVTI